MASPGARVGSALGHYRLTGELGTGGMGVVFRAHDESLGRDVAIKLLPAAELENPTARARLLREARTASQLNHPHICTIYEIGEAEGQAFIAMEVVEGQPLSARIAGGRALAAEEVLRYGLQVADALAHAHARGVVHRDLKSANVVITRDGRAKVLDFGLARRLDEPLRDDATRADPSLTSPGTVVGTPAYMAPEQLRGEPADPRSDVWALGVMLHEMAAGERPFVGPTAFEVSASILREAPRPLPGHVPPGLRAVIAKCLARDARERYRDAAELRTALEVAQQAGPAAAPPDQADQELKKEIDALRHKVAERESSGASAVAMPAAAVRRSVAVLPFLNLSADPENEFFADGITEDVIAQLSKMRSLKVISRTSAMQFKSRELGLREIAAKLGVATLIEGSVRRAGNRVRIVAELVDAATDEHLWAETYDRQLTDIFEIQSLVALSVAEALEAELSTAERARIEAPAAVNIEAYQLYLKGRQRLWRVTAAALQEALDLFTRAIAMEPRYAPPQAEMAWVHILTALGHGAGDVRPLDAYARAREAVNRALEIDPQYGPAHGILACVRFMADYDWAGAEQAFTRGLELSPGDFVILDAYGLMLSAQERFDEAIASQRRARDLDPLAPVANSDLATTLIRAGRYDEAIGEARRLKEMEPTFPLAHSTLGWALVLRGQEAEGLQALEEAVSLSPRNTLLLAQLGEACAMTGDAARARDVLARLQEMAGQRYVMPYHFAYVYTGLGEHEKAIDLLEEAVEERAGGAYGIKGSFLFTPLRPHPRFRALLRRINLPA